MLVAVLSRELELTVLYEVDADPAVAEGISELLNDCVADGLNVVRGRDVRGQLLDYRQLSGYAVLLAALLPLLAHFHRDAVHAECGDEVNRYADQQSAEKRALLI